MAVKTYEAGNGVKPAAMASMQPVKVIKGCGNNNLSNLAKIMANNNK